MQRDRAKRLFDVAVAAPSLVLTAPVIAVLIVAASIDTRTIGLFRQRRVGRNGRSFTVLKIRSMRASSAADTTITTSNDRRITELGRWMRRWKLDELPQLWNVALGHMSLVGPRPDVEGYADLLQGAERELLGVRPGITGPATLLFRREEELLAASDDPTRLNDDVIWPTKVAVNLAYVRRSTMSDDLSVLLMTVQGSNRQLAKMLIRWDPGLLDLPLVARELQRTTQAASTDAEVQLNP